MGSRNYTFDALLLMKDAVAVTASGAGQVSGTAKVLDMNNARFDGTVVVDVSAIKISAGDESYKIVFQGSNVANFASGVENLAVLDLGKGTARLGGAAQDSVVGRYEVGLTNEQADVTYRYIRQFTVVAGTSPSITNSAWLTQEPGR